VLAIIDLLQNVVGFANAIHRGSKRPKQWTYFGPWEDQKPVVKIKATADVS